MITLYHCDGARSFRPLWMLEEMGLPYELKMLPFPPRVFAKEYLAINPLGTIPFMVDGETKMTESSGICHYIGTRYGPTPLIVSTRPVSAEIRVIMPERLGRPRFGLSKNPVETLSANDGRPGT